MPATLKFAKPRPRALEKQDRAKRKRSIEEREDAKVKARSKGQCEVREVWTVGGPDRESRHEHRCLKRAWEIHHLLGGSGRRGVKESALAIKKLHVCSSDHELITRHILQGSWTDINDRAGTITYVRIK